MMAKPRAFTLLLVLTSLALAAALIVPLALVSGTRALAANEASDALRHRLAGDSLLAVLPEWLERDSSLVRDLCRQNRVVLETCVDEVQIRAMLQDDSAKLPLPAIYALPSGGAAAALNQIAVQTGVSHCSPADRASAPGCLDDLFTAPTDVALFGEIGGSIGWAQYVTTLGRSVNVKHAAAGVLEALLQDIQPGLGSSLARMRDRDRSERLEDWVASLELPERDRRRALERLSLRCERYSLLLETMLHGQTRRRYIVCTAGEPPQIIIDWQVAR